VRQAEQIPHLLALEEQALLDAALSVVRHLYRRFQASPHLAWGATSTPNKWYRPPDAGSKEFSALKKENQALAKSNAVNEGLVKTRKARHWRVQWHI
jgi:hypothetical protein